MSSTTGSITIMHIIRREKGMTTEEILDEIERSGYLVSDRKQAKKNKADYKPMFIGALIGGIIGQIIALIIIGVVK